MVVKNKVILLFGVILTLSSCVQSSHDVQKNKSIDDIHDTLNVGTSGYIESKKADINTIHYDLIGHTLAEGVNDGYFSPEWFYTINENNIRNLRIEKELVDTETEYIAIINLELGDFRPEKALICNFYYDTKAKIRYIKPQNGDWKIDYIKSLGMNIVSDKKYDDFIKVRLEGSNSVKLFLNNLSEFTLEVGGTFLASNYDWVKFFKVVPPHSEEFVDYAKDCVIDFVIREN